MDCLVSDVLIGQKEEAKEVTPELSPKCSRFWWRQVLPIAKQASVTFQRTSQLFVGGREGPCRKTLPFHWLQHRRSFTSIHKEDIGIVADCF